MVDPINNPRHYQFGQLEAWDIIELAIENTPDPVTAYHQASALKYLLRAARKGGNTDIAKASAHLKRETARHVTAAPDHDPAGVAFRAADRPQADKVWDALGKADAEYFALNYGFVPGDLDNLRCESNSLPESSRNLPNSAVELADADGCMEYGNPITPGCATTPWRLP